MRRYLILLIAILSIACTKEPQYATVTFDVEYVQSGAITKVSSGAVSEALAASMPTGPFQLHLVSKTNPLRSYDITTGSSVTIAVDDYTVTGSGVGSEVFSSSSTKVYSSPKWSVSQDIEVDAGGGSVNLTASYPCVALVVDKSVTASIEFFSGSGFVSPSAMGGTESVGVVYAVGYWTFSTPLRIRVYPVDYQANDIVDYNLTSNAYDGTYRVLNGHWYNFVPGDLEPSSGSFGINFSGWEAGQ